MNVDDGLVGVVFVVCLARVVKVGGVKGPRNVFAIAAFADDDENVVHFARHQPTLPGVPPGTCRPTQLHGVQVRHATSAHCCSALIDEDDQADAVRIHTHATLRYGPEGCGRWGALHRVRLVGDRAVCRDDVSRLAVPSPADVVGKSAARIVGGNSTHARGTDGEVVGAVPAPTREPRVMAAPRPATAMTFFIVRYFFSFALFAECSVGPSVSSFPSTSTANLANYFLHNSRSCLPLLPGAGLFATHYACGSQLQRDWMSLAYGPAVAIAAWTTTPRPPPDTP